MFYFGNYESSNLRTKSVRNFQLILFGLSLYPEATSRKVTSPLGTVICTSRRVTSPLGTVTCTIIGSEEVLKVDSFKFTVKLNCHCMTKTTGLRWQRV